MNDIDVMLIALKKEREIAHERVLQLDRIIKRIKEGKYSNDKDEAANEITPARQPAIFNQSFKTADIKVQILRVFDVIGKASKLQAIQDEFNRLTESSYNIRDTVRSLQNSKKLKMIKEAGASRGFLWAKAEWIDNDRLLDEYKPEGFDLLYRADNLIFE